MGPVQQEVMDRVSKTTGMVAVEGGRTLAKACMMSCALPSMVLACSRNDLDTWCQHIATQVSNPLQTHKLK